MSQENPKNLTYEDAKIVKETEQLLGGIDAIEALRNHKWKWYEWPEIIWLRYIVRPTEDFFRAIKYFIQRGLRGYSDEDRWSFDSFFSKIILEELVWLKTEGHGIPSTEGPDGKWDFDEERWKKVLDEMIDGFAILRKCTLGEELEWGGYCESEEDKLRLNKIFTKHRDHCRFTTKEEENKVYHAFDLFKKYYWNIND